MDDISVRAPYVYPEGTTADDNVDNVLSTDDQIIDSIMDEKPVDDAMNDDGDDDGDGSEEPTCPKVTDVRNALEVLRKYMLFSKKEKFKEL